jgi:hypothetical protein
MPVMRANADKLHDKVLLKRIRFVLGGLTGGLFPREFVEDSVPEVGKPDFSTPLRARIEERLKQHLDGLAIDSLVQRERDALEGEWADVNRRLTLAPGEEILSAVYSSFGTEYAKASDAKSIASEMESSEIVPEITQLIKEVVALADSTRAVALTGEGPA